MVTEMAVVCQGWYSRDRLCVKFDAHVLLEVKVNAPRYLVYYSRLILLFLRSETHLNHFNNLKITSLGARATSSTHNMATMSSPI